MKQNARRLVLAFCLAAGVANAATNSEVVTGGHALSAMMTADPVKCEIDVSGTLNPQFKGADPRVDLVCQNASCPGCANAAHVVASTACENAFGCNTVDVCTGKFVMTIFGSFDANGGCMLPQAAPGEVCYFVAHVSSTNRQACGGSTSGGPDPSGTAPCSSGYCNP